MTALQVIIKEAKAIRKKSPKMEWKKAVAQASAIYASKHKGKSPVGKKKVVKKKASKKVGTVHLAKSTNENIKLLENKIKQQKALLKTDKKNTYLKNVLKTNQNSLNFLKKGKKKVGAVKKSATTMHKDTKSHNVNIRVMSGISGHAMHNIDKELKQIKHLESLIRSNEIAKKNTKDIKAKKAMSNSIKKYKELMKEHKIHITQLKKHIK
jgi:hypothetical protein